MASRYKQLENRYIRQMRIVYVLNTLATGGAEKQVLAIAGHMAERGHSVVLLVLKERQAEECATDLDVVYLGVRKSASSFLRGLRRGVAFLRDFRPDLVHSHNFHGNIAARLMRIMYPNAKLISTLHNVYEGGRLRMLAYRCTDGLAAVTTAVSEAVEKRYAREKAVGKAKCVVIRNAIDVREFAPDAERRLRTRAAMKAGEHFVWLSVGRISPAKDYPNLIEAFGRMRDEWPHSQLWIAGDVAKGGEKLHRTLIAEQVSWLGFRRDVAALLDAADGFVLGSAWEGMPLALGEAMAMEKPVVATDVGGVRELVGEAGLTVPAGDTSALSGAMTAVMRMIPSERAALGRAGRTRIAKQFSMDERTKEWEAFYRSVLDQA